MVEMANCFFTNALEACMVIFLRENHPVVRSHDGRQAISCGSPTLTRTCNLSDAGKRTDKERQDIFVITSYSSGLYRNIISVFSGVYARVRTNLEFRAQCQMFLLFLPSLRPPNSGMRPTTEGHSAAAAISVPIIALKAISADLSEENGVVLAIFFGKTSSLSYSEPDKLSLLLFQSMCGL